MIHHSRTIDDGVPVGENSCFLQGQIVPRLQYLEPPFTLDRGGRFVEKVSDTKNMIAESFQRNIVLLIASSPGTDSV